MIRAEYPKVYQYLHEEKQKHLESLAVEGKIIFNQLRRSVARMRHMGKLLRKMYEELKEMCFKTDVDLFQVRTKERCQGAEHQPAEKSLLSTEFCTPWTSIIFHFPRSKSASFNLVILGFAPPV